MSKMLCEDIKARVPLIDAIGRDQLRLQGPRYLRHREHSSLVVDTATQRWHWNARGWRGDVIDWHGHERYGDVWDPRDREMFQTVLAALVAAAGLNPADRTPPTRPRARPDLALWLLGRGIREGDARRLGIDTHGDGVSYPVLVAGEEIARRWKAFDSRAKPKYRWLRHSQTAHLYGLDTMADGGLLVAGEPDVWVCTQAGVPACSLLYGEGTPPKPKAIALLRERGITRLRVVYDHDDAGRAGAHAAAATLSAAGIAATIHPLPGEVGAKGDLTDLYRLVAHDDRAFRDAIAGLAEETVPIPDSRFSKGSGIGNAADGENSGENGVVRVWERPEPTPRRFAVAGLVPDKAITALYGDGGQGKSYIALALSMHATLGRSFAGVAVERRTALYIDAELDEDEFVRRAYKVARGLDLSGPPAGLHYWQLPGSLSDPLIQEMACQRIAACGATLVVLDSLTIASYGSDPSAAQEMTAVLKAIESWGVATITIDHSAKPPPGANLSGYRQFGSAFKGYISRSVIQVVRAEGGGVALRQTKTNFGPLAAPINLALEFTPEAVRITPIAAVDERMAGIEEHLPAIERVAHALAAYPQGAAAQELADELAMSLKTVRNHLSALGQKRRAERLGGGRWAYVPDSRSLNDRESGTTPQPAVGDEEVAEWSA